MQVGGLIDHLPQSIVVEKGPKAADVSAIWLVIKWRLKSPVIIRSPGVVVYWFKRSENSVMKV